MAFLFLGNKFQAFDSSGDPLASGKVYTYSAGTTTPLATYTTQAGGTSNANPVILDAAGRADIWLGTEAYRIIVKTSADVTVSDTDNILGSSGLSTQLVTIQAACSDETSALTTGTGKLTFRAPHAFTLTDVRASVSTAPTGGTLLTVDVNKNGTTMLSTKLTFDASEKTTVTATTQRVISVTAIASDDEISVDIDAVGSTIAGAGLKITLIGTYP